MTSSNSNSKSDFRAQMRARLANISLAVRTVRSWVCARLEPQLQVPMRFILCAIADELDVWPLMEKMAESKKTCALPSFDTSETNLHRAPRDKFGNGHRRSLGFSEPLTTCETIPLRNTLHLILVPGTAFDANGNRLGRGNGFTTTFCQKRAVSNAAWVTIFSSWKQFRLNRTTLKWILFLRRIARVKRKQT